MEELKAKFPKMRPVKKPPTLSTMNGCGLGVCGKRDVDPETGTYVKTYCITALYIPVIALGAYRVADAGSGSWYFLGKEPLSRFARTWNFILLGVLALLIGGGGIAAHFGSPQYQASRQLKQGAAQARAGKHLEAATIYRRMFEGGHLLAEARQGLKSAVEACLRSESAATIGRALQLCRLPAGAPPVLPNAVDLGTAQLEKFRGTDPDGAIEIVTALQELSPKDEKLPPLKVALLKEVISKEPEKVNRVVELAVHHEDHKQLEESQKLLLPYRAKLGDTEGARILGQHLLKEGEYDNAYGLLYPYVQKHLATLRTVEQVYTNAYARSIEHAYQALNNRQAPTDFYQRYENASKAEQERLVSDFMDKWFQRDPQYQAALAKLTTANKIVPVTLDLGIVQVNRAQGLADAQKRKSELEAAEKTFLAIRGLAGETDEYRLFLGEVYYWLGKAAQGKELFDQLLKANKRAVPILLALSSKLRMVGETVQARELSEEAYRNAKNDKERFEAAALRAVQQIDNDDRIKWLAKADPNEPTVQISLNSTRGDKALEEGNKELAAQLLRKAAVAYDGIPKNSVNLNNCGLVYLDLYRATGNRQDLQRGLGLLEEAVSMDPGNSLLLINTLHTLITHALMEVVGDSIRLSAISEEAEFGTLSHLYNDEQGRTEVYGRLRESPSMKKAIAYLDRALLLAPKRLNLYLTALNLQSHFRDAGEMKKLQQRLQTAAPDHAEVDQQYLEGYSGARDKERTERVRKSQERYRQLLQKSEITDHAATKRYLLLELNELRREAWTLGEAVDADEMVRAAIGEFDAHKSSATRAAVTSALYFRAVTDAARQNPEFDTLVKRSRRGLHPRYLTALLLDKGGAPGDMLRKHPDIQKALELEKESARLFPATPGPDDWALFRNTDLAHAEAIAQVFKGNAATQLSDELGFELTPLRVTSVMDRYWGLRLAGQEKQAAEIYQQALRKNLPLPAL